LQSHRKTFRNRKIPVGSRPSSERLSPGTRRAFGVGRATQVYRTRLMQDLMDEEDLDGLAFTSSDYIKFATNFDVDVSGFERPCLCVIPRNGRPFAILHELSENHWHMSRNLDSIWISEASFYSEHPRTTQRLPLTSQWQELVASRLREARLHRARLGTDGGLPARLIEFLPRLHLENVSRQCERLRWIKHDEELSIMRAAADLADWAQERYRENIRPGRLVADLDTAMASLMAHEAAKRMPGADIGIYCWTLSGPVSASPHGLSPFGNLAGATIKKGHVLITSVYPAIDGLFIENERTWICGPPSKRQIHLFEAARAANEAACGAAISGRPISSIDAAAQEAFFHRGVDHLIRHRTGHGLGIGGHDYPIDMPFNGNPLQDNMVFSIEPGVYELGIGGFRHDDTVIVGPTASIVTKTTRDLKSQTIL